MTLDLITRDRRQIKDSQCPDQDSAPSLGSLCHIVSPQIGPNDAFGEQMLRNLEVGASHHGHALSRVLLAI